MSGLQALYNQLEKIQTNNRSEKVTIRQKSLEELDQILNSRSNDLMQLSINDSAMWINLFDSAHEAILQQSKRYLDTMDKKALNLLESRSAMHKIVIQKILNIANANCLAISLNIILEKCFHCFDNRTLSKYFGECYLQILDKNVLCSAACNLGEIKTKSWQRKFSGKFSFY